MHWKLLPHLVLEVHTACALRLALLGLPCTVKRGQITQTREAQGAKGGASSHLTPSRIADARCFPCSVTKLVALNKLIPGYSTAKSARSSRLPCERNWCVAPPDRKEERVYPKFPMFSQLQASRNFRLHNCIENPKTKESLFCSVVHHCSQRISGCSVHTIRGPEKAFKSQPPTQG